MTEDASTTASEGGWEGLAPWEKAREWRDTYPDLADEIISLGRQHAIQVWELRKEEVKVQLRLDQEKSDAEIAMQVRDSDRKERIATEVSEANKIRATHIRQMESRLYWLQVVVIVASLLAIVGNGIVALTYSQKGNTGPGLAVFGAGGLLTSLVYLTGRDTSRKLASSLEAERSDEAGSPSAR